MLNSTTTNATNATVVEWDFIEAPLHGLGALSDRFQEGILALADSLPTFNLLTCSLHTGRSPQQVEWQLCGSNFRDPSTLYIMASCGSRNLFSIAVVALTKKSSTVIPTVKSTPEISRLSWRKRSVAATLKGR